MFEIFREIFGIGKSRINHLNNNNAFGFSKVHNKNGLFKEIIRIVPDNSIWLIDEFQSQEIYETLKSFIIEDEFYLRRTIIFPNPNSFKIQLTQESKKIITLKINSGHLDWDIMHQHIYKGGKTYLNSYDHLHEACTWIANELKGEIQNIEKLIEMK